MDSESSSSSPKRSVSLDPNHDGHDTPRPKDMSTLSISDGKHDQDIDAYMAEQGEGSMSQALDEVNQPHLTNGAPASAPQTPAATESPAAKLAQVEQLRKGQMQIGETWYIVAKRWYKRWHKACSGEEDKEGKVEEKDLGAVDNKPLVDIRGELTASCVEGVDVEFVPEQVWRLFVSWYVMFTLVQCHPDAVV